MALQDVLDRLGSDPIIRNWDTYANYDPTGTHKNVLFLATDEKKFYFNGEEYGGVPEYFATYIEHAQSSTSNLSLVQDDWVTIAKFDGQFFSGLINVRHGWQTEEPNGVTLALNISTHDTSNPTDRLTVVLLNKPLNNFNGSSLPLSFKAIRVIKKDTERLLQLQVNKSTIKTMAVDKIGIGLYCVTPEKTDVTDYTVLAEEPIKPYIDEVPVLDFGDTVSSNSQGHLPWYGFYYTMSKTITQTNPEIIQGVPRIKVKMKYPGGTTPVEFYMDYLNDYVGTGSVIHRIYMANVPLKFQDYQTFAISLNVNTSTGLANLYVTQSSLNKELIGNNNNLSLSVWSDEDPTQTIYTEGVAKINTQEELEKLIKGGVAYFNQMAITIYDNTNTSQELQRFWGALYYNQEGNWNSQTVRATGHMIYMGPHVSRLEILRTSYPTYEVSFEYRPTQWRQATLPLEIPIYFRCLSLGTVKCTEAEYNSTGQPLPKLADYQYLIPES